MNFQLINANVVDGLRQLPDASVHCVVTSPPYWGLRDYGTPAQVWGGDPECDHEWGETIRTPWANDLPGPNGRKLNSDAARQRPKQTGPFCQKCNAWRGSLGLEPEPELFVRNLVMVFREVRRVLRPEGVCFVNLGDSYYGSWQNYGGGNRGAGKQRPIVKGSQAQNPVWEGKEGYRPAATYDHPILKPKDLIGAPWRVAFALQADGWYLRSDIIWSKPNPMPESVTDRPTKSHEYLFLLTKSPKYFYDNEAIKEEAIYGRRNDPDDTAHPARKAKSTGIWRNVGDGREPVERGRNQRNATYDKESGRNRRSVWIMATQPNPEAHFATFPEELPELCIKAGTSERGCCRKCGAPFARVVEKGLTAHDGKTESAYANGSTANRLALLRQATRERGEKYSNATKTIGWKPTYKCEDAGDPIDCVVLDPFCGTATTGVVALRLGRRFIGIELSKDYCEISERRLREAERQAYGDLFLPLQQAARPTLF